MSLMAIPENKMFLKKKARGQVANKETTKSAATLFPAMENTFPAVR